MSGKAKKYCLAAGCYNNDKNSDRTFFALPSGQAKEDDERCRKWLTLLGRKDMLENERLRKRSYSVCCAHFDDSQIKIAKSLVKGSIPTLFLANPNGLSSSKEQTVEVEVPAILSESAKRTPVLSKTIKTEPKSTQENIKVPAILSSESVEKTSMKHIYDSENITVKSEPISNEQEIEIPVIVSLASGEITSFSNIAVKEVRVPAILTSEIAENTLISNVAVKIEPTLVDQEIAVPAIVSSENAENTSVLNVAKLNSEPTPIELDVTEKSTQTGSFLMKRKLSDDRKKNAGTSKKILNK